MGSRSHIDAPKRAPCTARTVAQAVVAVFAAVTAANCAEVSLPSRPRSPVPASSSSSASHSSPVLSPASGSICGMIARRRVCARPWVRPPGTSGKTLYLLDLAPGQHRRPPPVGYPSRRIIACEEAVSTRSRPQTVAWHPRHGAGAVGAAFRPNRAVPR